MFFRVTKFKLFDASDGRGGGNESTRRGGNEGSVLVGSMVDAVVAELNPRVRGSRYDLAGDCDLLSGVVIKGLEMSSLF